MLELGCLILIAICVGVWLLAAGWRKAIKEHMIGRER